MRFARFLVQQAPRLIVRLLYGNIWKLRNQLKTNGYRLGGVKWILYNSYWESFGSFIGIGAELEDIPTFPHGPLGVFISNSAHIGKRCVIFQQVTIGSNMLKGSKKEGAPRLEDNIYIGCGAKIIGKVRVGKNARIGANAVVVKDVPPNSVTVLKNIETLVRDYELDNTYVANLI